MKRCGSELHLNNSMCKVYVIKNSGKMIGKIVGYS